jgi:hypothetical protein
MKRLDKRTLRISSWDFYSYLIFTVVLLFQVASWPKFPLFMDCYYHLSVMRGFHDAGGWVGSAFWEYAPVGRPHLYPPLLHILELILFKCWMPAILIARLFDFIIYPAFVFIFWKVIRTLHTRQLAFASLFFITSSNTLYLAILNNIPFSIALLLGLLSFYSYEKKRYLSAILFLALTFYTHSLVCWLLFLTFCFYYLFDRRGQRFLLRVLLGALLLVLPLLMHQLQFLTFVHLQRAMEYYVAALNPLLYSFALFGIAACIRRKGRYFFWVCLTLALSLLLVSNRDRFLSGQGLVPFSFFAAATAVSIWKWLYRANRIRLRTIFAAIMIFVFYLWTPLVLISPFQKRISVVITSWLSSQIGIGEKFSSSKAETIYYPKLINEVVRLVRENSFENDIIYSNYEYAGGMVAMLAHRATSTAMLPEVMPYRSFDPISDSKLILWFKEPTGKNSLVLSQLAGLYRLKKIGETGLVFLYANDRCRFQRKVLPASLPYGVCLAILFLAFATIMVKK